MNAFPIIMLKKVIGNLWFKKLGEKKIMTAFQYLNEKLNSTSLNFTQSNFGVKFKKWSKILKNGVILEPEIIRKVKFKQRYFLNLLLLCKFLFYC